MKLAIMLREKKLNKIVIFSKTLYWPQMFEKISYFVLINKTRRLKKCIKKF